MVISRFLGTRSISVLAGVLAVRVSEDGKVEACLWDRGGRPEKEDPAFEGIRRLVTFYSTSRMLVGVDFKNSCTIRLRLWYYSQQCSQWGGDHCLDDSMSATVWPTAGFQHLHQVGMAVFWTRKGIVHLDYALGLHGSLNLAFFLKQSGVHESWVHKHKVGTMHHPPFDLMVFHVEFKEEAFVRQWFLAGHFWSFPDVRTSRSELLEDFRPDRERFRAAFGVLPPSVWPTYDDNPVMFRDTENVTVYFNVMPGISDTMVFSSSDSIPPQDGSSSKRAVQGKPERKRPGALVDPG